MVADRLALHGGGLLTLVAFKYAISEQLPSVPYTTFTDKYLMVQVILLVLLSGEAVVSYKVTEDNWIDKDGLEVYETTLLVFMLVFWTLCFLIAAFCWKRRSWSSVLDTQTSN